MSDIRIRDELQRNLDISNDHWRVRGKVVPEGLCPLEIIPLRAKGSLAVQSLKEAKELREVLDVYIKAAFNGEEDE